VPVEATTRRWRTSGPDEEEEQPASGAEERGHSEESDAAAGALTWQELFSGWGAL
jgi:hypothetical protein